MNQGPESLTIRLIRNPGWYSIPLSFGEKADLVLMAAVNPPQPMSLITQDAAEQLKRWEFIESSARTNFQLTGIRLDGQSIPSFEVRTIGLRRRFRWDLIIGYNFFEKYAEMTLDIHSSTARLVAR